MRKLVCILDPSLVEKIALKLVLHIQTVVAVATDDYVRQQCVCVGACVGCNSCWVEQRK